MQDELAIAAFIDASNCLLPDDETRAKVGFRREDMEFRVAANGPIRNPAYMDHGREVCRRCLSWNFADSFFVSNRLLTYIFNDFDLQVM